MRAYLSENASQILDGLLFGLGVLAVYLGAVLTGALVRSLGGAGSKGILVAGKYAQGWFDYIRGDDRNTINVTLNMVIDDRLLFDTLVADINMNDVWPNAYRAQRIRGAAKRTTVENPVILFPDDKPARRGWLTRRLSSMTVMENGKRQRVEMVPEDDYKATYGPLISLVSEKCSNDHAIDLSIGYPMEEYRFVLALTYEKLHNRRARHLRAMVMYEPMLLALPPECPKVDVVEHETRYRTLRSIGEQYRRNPERFGVVKVWRHRNGVTANGTLHSADAAPQSVTIVAAITTG